VISTGAISFDAALGVGGVPRGRVVEIFGPESSGKTDHRLAGDCRGAKELEAWPPFVDAEHALDPAYAKKLGVDVDNLLVSQPTMASRRWKSLKHWCARTPIDVLVWTRWRRSSPS